MPPPSWSSSFARASEFYFGRRLSSLTAADADKAALLAAIMKSPDDYAPTARNPALILRRRNQILQLMAEAGAISRAQLGHAEGLPVLAALRHDVVGVQSSAVMQHVLEELTASHPDLGLDDLLQGRIQIASTVGAHVQAIVTAALEHGLARYEARHPATEYGDLNRARQSLRQPGSAMKPIVYMQQITRDVAEPEAHAALFVGSTYGADGITVAVRIGFDDDRSLGQAETAHWWRCRCSKKSCSACIAAGPSDPRRHSRTTWSSGSRSMWNQLPQ